MSLSNVHTLYKFKSETQKYLNQVISILLNTSLGDIRISFHCTYLGHHSARILSK